MRKTIKNLRLTKGICADLNQFKQIRKSLNDIQQQINDKHSRIKNGEEELEINEELRQLYATAYEQSKKEQDLIIVILAELSQLVEKAEERQQKEEAAAAALTIQSQIQSNSNASITSPTLVTTPTTSLPPTIDAMQVEELELPPQTTTVESINTSPIPTVTAPTIATTAVTSSSSNNNTIASKSVSTKEPPTTRGKKKQKKNKTEEETKTTSPQVVKEETAVPSTSSQEKPITMDKYLGSETDEIPVGSKVAARISGTTEESGDTGFWILASVVKYIPDKGRYEVEDEDPGDEENPGKKRYKLNKKHIIPLPTDFSQHKVFKKGDQVFAIFPNTTTFYRAIVKTLPTAKNQRNYYLEFEDDEEDGGTPQRKVSYKYVIPIPKN
ncbi:hypothetical protein ABK040_007182 [Willaertia magna]